MTTPDSPAHTPLEQAQARFTFLADLIPQLVWFTDPKGSHTYFNQRWIDYTGYTLEASLGPDMWNNLLHPDDQHRARQRWGHSLATGEFYEIEYRFKSKQGDYRWFLGQALPQRNAQGEIEQWFGTCTDIHDQKLNALALRQREQDFATLTDAIDQLVWMADAEGSIFWYNERWYQFTGTDLESMKGWGWEKVHHPEHRERVVNFVREAWGAGQPWELTFPLRRYDGEYRWFLTRAIPVRNEQGHVERWCGTNTDITEQKQLVEQLENAYADLEMKITFRTLELEREVLYLRRQLGIC
ncbi:PAS domain-containing protein [Hymenobacter sp. BT175]|nr:PAS domain-containing protein [Hymenobacter translucens]